MLQTPIDHGRINADYSRHKTRDVGRQRPGLPGI